MTKSKYDKPYFPSSKHDRQVEEFQNLIGMSIKQWLTDMVKEGYGQRWISDKTGFSAYLVRRLIETYGIKRTSKFKPSYNGSSVRTRLVKEGIYTPQLYWRVIYRTSKGMSYHLALKEALNPRKYTI